MSDFTLKELFQIKLALKERRTQLEDAIYYLHGSNSDLCDRLKCCEILLLKVSDQIHMLQSPEK